MFSLLFVLKVADFSEKKAQQDIKENKEDIIKIFKVVFLLSFISELNYLRGVYKEKTHRILFIEIKIKNNIRRKKKGYYNNNSLIMDDEEKKRKKRRTKNERRKMRSTFFFFFVL